jgi:hypothetical protein
MNQLLATALTPESGSQLWTVPPVTHRGQVWSAQGWANNQWPAVYFAIHPSRRTKRKEVIYVGSTVGPVRARIMGHGVLSNFPQAEICYFEMPGLDFGGKILTKSQRRMHRHMEILRDAEGYFSKLSHGEEQNNHESKKPMATLQRQLRLQIGVVCHEHILIWLSHWCRRSVELDVQTEISDISAWRKKMAKFDKLKRRTPQ